VDANDPVVSRELVKNWLEEPFEGTGSQGKRIKWMLIFDGADDPDILHDYWPQAQDGSILVTSRDPLMKTSVFPVNGGIELTGIYSEDAALLLRKLIDPESNSSIVDETLLNVVKKAGLLSPCYSSDGGCNMAQVLEAYGFSRHIQSRNRASRTSQSSRGQPEQLPTDFVLDLGPRGP
jgi:hypothetical protein